jgi:chemotaxis protein CheZ
MTPNLSAAISTMLASLHQRKGSITIEDLRDILESINGMLSTETSAIESFLRDEIIGIASHIETMKNEIVALSADTATADKKNEPNTATKELSAVLKATEEAAQDIMNTADEIQTLINSENISDIFKKKITALTTHIYEACNFQDLTGQRITKVMQALDFIESRIGILMGMFASDGSVNLEKFRNAAMQRKDVLLNGPQLSAPTQSEIDALFGKLE